MLRTLTLLCLFLCCRHLAADELERAEFFEAKIRPVLIKHCYECHSASSKTVGGELLLDSRHGLQSGGESGEALVAGKPEASLLIEAVRYEGLEMPPAGKLPERIIADLQTWIRDGAHDPREEVARPAIDTQTESGVDIEAGRQFWSFQRPSMHDRPDVQNTAWPQKKIDWFVLSRLEEKGLGPNHAADRATLIRRLTFDLTGLPPTPSEVEQFINDEQPDAYRRVVERLLASPQFGARWARLWLDVARYAEDQAHIVGNNQSLFYPNAYRYRDWLIKAFNDDMPYDQFVRVQLAADLLGEEGEAHIPGLGFLGLGPKYYRRNAPEVMADEWEDRVDTVTRGFLGMTVACARCHDHKYDPIPTEDYYALAGVFASTEMHNLPPPGWKPTEKKKKPDPAETLHVIRDGKPRDLKVHIRGDAFNEGELAPRRFMQVLYEEEKPLEDGSGRLPLAEAIADPQNPLTARVIVNRIWGQYFGRPLVGTPSNFGKLGQAPTHPQLLDDLAVRFMNEGWSLKWLHREIVLSATYRQSSDASMATTHADPDNALLGRMSHRRLGVEMWRDAMLSVCGQLDDQVGGDSLDVEDTTTTRRTVYSKVSRLELNPMLHLFDYPDPNVHAARRVETTTPLQKLFALNSPFMVHRAQQLAKRVRSHCDQTEDQIEHAYQLLYARSPTSQELNLGVAYLLDGDVIDQWNNYAQILLASNEMLYLD